MCEYTQRVMKKFGIVNIVLAVVLVALLGVVTKFLLDYKDKYDVSSRKEEMNEYAEVLNNMYDYNFEVKLTDGESDDNIVSNYRLVYNRETKQLDVTANDTSYQLIVDDYKVEGFTVKGISATAEEMYYQGEEFDSALGFPQNTLYLANFDSKAIEERNTHLTNAISEIKVKDQFDELADGYGLNLGDYYITMKKMDGVYYYSISGGESASNVVIVIGGEINEE